MDDFLPKDFDSLHYYYLNKELLDSLDFTEEDRDVFFKNHYIQEGCKKGLKYKIVVPEDFSIKKLIKYNNDLNYLDISSYFLAAKKDVNNLEAYKHCEAESGRVYALTLPEDFCVTSYKKYNPDLAGMSDDAAAIHYVKYGKNENRLYRLNLPQNFNSAEYVYLNPDLLGMSAGELERHYFLHGMYEKRKYFDSLFDKDYFIKINSKADSAGYEDYLKDIRQIKSKFVHDEISKLKAEKIDLLLVSHETSLFGATHYLYSLYLYLKDRYPRLKIKVAEKSPDAKLLEKYGLAEDEVFYYYNDCTLLYYIYTTAQPSTILINSTNLTADSILPYLSHETKVIRHSHEVKEYYLGIHKNTVPSYVVSSKISKQWEEIPKIQPPFIDVKSRQVIDFECAQPLTVIRNTVGDIDLSKITIGMCGQLTVRKNPELFVNLCKYFVDYNFIWVGGARDITEETVPNLYHVRDVSLPYRYFSCFDYFLLTSTVDPCPYVVLENIYINNRVITFKENIYTCHDQEKLQDLYFEYPGEISFNSAVEAIQMYVKTKKNFNLQGKGRDYIQTNYGKPTDGFIEDLL